MKTSFCKQILLALLASASLLSAAQPEDGKIYRLVSRYYPTLAATEDISTGGIVTRAIGDKETFDQMWRFDASGTGFTLTNVLTDNVISSYGGPNNQYWTDSDAAKAHTFQLVSPVTGYWNVRHNTGMGGLHSAWTGKVVYWHDNAAEATQWKLEEITGISEEQLSLKQLVYRNYVNLTTHETEYNDRLRTFFTDESCSELLPSAASLSDEALVSSMSDLPEVFRTMALKIKNGTWGHREQQFRIRDYAAYSDPEYWHEVLLITRPGRINNPTGIYGNAGDIILVFVAEDIPSGASLQLEFIQGTDIQGSAVALHRGLNVLTVADDASAFYVQYIGTTTADEEQLITDFPPLRIHIEGGIVNGFWNMAEHNDEDWADILAHATAPAIDVKGEKVMFHMHTSVMRKNCPQGIHDAIDWWEDMLHWQHDIMGVDDYVPHKCNNMACAITLDDNNTYMAATWYRTQYHVNVVYKILNFSTVITDPDYCFGPAHENGHMGQGAINVVGCTESSNGIHENLVVWKIGKYLTRGPAPSSAYNAFAEGTPWPLRANDEMLRLHWQLYLYFHACGVDTTFWPRVFKAMRRTPLPIRWGGKHEVTAAEDMLLFARTCCDVAQLDLSEFFRIYGFLTPHERMETRESGNYLTTPQKDIDAFLAYVSRYPKAPPIEFIDDRIKPEPRTDGGTGARLIYDYGVGQCGDVGHYTDFLDTSVPAEGYIYSRSSSTISIKDGTGAVGFRIYNKDTDALLYPTNCLRFTLPRSCQAAPLRLVAVQADGTEVRIPSTAEAGTEAEQLAALRSSLTSAKSILDLRDDDGYTVARYFGFALGDLQTLYDAANTACDAADQTAHTYGQWALLLDDAVHAVRSNAEALVPLYPENVYALYMPRYKNYSLYNLVGGPKGNTLDPAANDTKQWRFVPLPAGDGYAIQCLSDGLFITSAESGMRVKLQSTDIADAVPIVLQPATNAGLVNLAISGTGLYLSYNESKEAVCTSEPSPWRLTTVADSHVEALSLRADAYQRIAQYMEEELLHDDDPALVSILSDDYSALRQQFNEALATVRDLVQHPTEGRLDLRLADLWEAMEALVPAYCFRQISHTEPFAGAIVDDILESPWGGYYVYLMNYRTGTYAYYNDQPGRYEGCLRMGALTDPDDLRFQFRIERDSDGGYYLRNLYSQRLAALWGSYIEVTGDRTVVPFNIAYDDDAQGYLIHGDEGYWTSQTSAGGYAQYRATGTAWKFLVGGYYGRTDITPSHVVAPADATLYDLTGRPVVLPTSGIYIQKGKKNWVK